MSNKLIHYSRQSGLKTLDPEFMGTGAPSEELKQGPVQTKQTSFYREGAEPESVVASGAKSKYTVNLGPEHKLYDIYEDPQGLVAQSVKQTGRINTDHIRGTLKNAGYHGFYTSHPTYSKQGVVNLFHSMPVSGEEEFGKTELKKSPLIGDYSEEIEENAAPKSIRNIQQLWPKAISNKHENVIIHSVGNDDFKNKGKDAFGFHYITDNNRPYGNILSYIKVVGTEGESKGPFIAESLTHKNYRGKGFSSHLHNYASDFHNGIYSDTSISPKEHSVWAKNKRSVLGPIDSDYESNISSQHYLPSSINKSEVKPKKEPHPFKVGDRVKRKPLGSGHGVLEAGTVTAVKTEQGRKHKMKVKHDYVGAKEFNKVGHGGKWDLWQHASYWEKHSDDINKSDLQKSPYGPKGAGLYSVTDNARRKMDRTSEDIGWGPNKAVHSTKPTAGQQATSEAKEYKLKSKKNPVKIYSPEEIKAFEQSRLAASEDLKKEFFMIKSDVLYQTLTRGSARSSLMMSQKDTFTSNLQRNNNFSSQGLNKSSDYSKISTVPEEDLMKAKILRDSLIGNAIMMGLAINDSIPKKEVPPPAPVVQQVENKKPVSLPKDDFHEKMLRTVASVESGGGINYNHETVRRGLNAGTRAIGSYGLMPLTVKEIVKGNPNLSKKYGHIIPMAPDQVKNELEKSPKVQHEIASTHLSRLTKIFGNNPAAIGMAWLRGIEGTKRAIKGGENIKDHWHVKKILKQFNKK